MGVNGFKLQQWLICLIDSKLAVSQLFPVACQHRNYTLKKMLANASMTNLPVRPKNLTIVFVVVF